MSYFNAISPLNGGRLNTYFLDWEYPYDLNGSLDYVRPKTGSDTFPHPQSIGSIYGLSPLMDASIFAIMLGQQPNGTPVDLLNSQGLSNFAFPDITGAMQKIGT